jgi:hypothetical protein
VLAAQKSDGNASAALALPLPADALLAAMTVCRALFSPFVSLPSRFEARCKSRDCGDFSRKGSLRTHLRRLPIGLNGFGTGFALVGRDLPDPSIHKD